MKKQKRSKINQRKYIVVIGIPERHKIVFNFPYIYRLLQRSFH